jgi:hypothetical protein
MTKTKTLQPAYRKIEEWYNLPSLAIYTNSNGKEEVAISNYKFCVDNKDILGNILIWKYSDGKLIEHPANKRKLPSYLERMVNKFPSHVKQAMGIPKRAK